MKLKELLAILAFLAVGVEAKAVDWFCYNSHGQYIAYIDERGRVKDPNLDIVGYRDGKFLYSVRDKVSGLFIYKKIYDMKGRQQARCYRGEL